MSNKALKAQEPDPLEGKSADSYLHLRTCWGADGSFHGEENVGNEHAVQHVGDCQQHRPSETPNVAQLGVEVREGSLWGGSGMNG